MADATRDVRARARAAAARKAAILMVSLDPESSARLMAELDRAEQERVTLEIVRLEDAPPEPGERERVLREFYTAIVAREAGDPGGLAAARQILERLHPPEEARRILQGIEQALGRSRFEFLRRADPENVVAFLSDEHPQMIALILSHLEPAQAARIVEELPIVKQQEVIRRLASLEPTSPEVVRQVEQALESRLASLVAPGFRQADGVAAAAQILNLVRRSTERTLLEGLRADEPELAERIRRAMFTFGDLLRVNDRGIQNLLKHVDTTRLALALKTAKPEIREKFFRNMSQRARERIAEELELMGPVRVADVEAAQQAIVDEVLRLEEAGELVVEGRSDAESLMVE
jgi:flagellar motor switch protein FliG